MNFLKVKCPEDHWKNIGESLGNLRHELRNSDLHFLVYNSNGLVSRIFAHQFIFIYKSRLLRKLCKEVKGKHGISEPVIITLLGVESITVEALISYFYYGHTNLKLMDGFCDLCRSLGIVDVNRITLEYIRPHANTYTNLVDPPVNTKVWQHNSSIKILTNNLSECDRIALMGDKKIYCSPKVSLLKKWVKEGFCESSAIKEDPSFSNEIADSHSSTLFRHHRLLRSHKNKDTNDKSDNCVLECLSKKMKINASRKRKIGTARTNSFKRRK